VGAATGAAEAVALWDGGSAAALDDLADEIASVCAWVCSAETRRGRHEHARDTALAVSTHRVTSTQAYDIVSYAVAPAEQPLGRTQEKPRSEAQEGALSCLTVPTRQRGAVRPERREAAQP
jgi:hypothetical protein